MNFCVVGAGAWGTAFALHLARGGRSVALAPRKLERATAIASARENVEYLPGVTLPESVRVVGALEEALAGADVVFLAVPTQVLRDTAKRVREAGGASAGRFFISLAKGLELRTHLRPTQIIAEAAAGSSVGALTGPTNAGEFARGLPAAMVLASEAHARQVAEIQAAISGATLRVYTTEDLAGAEYGGSLKNIYAIAAGCSDGLRLGDNAKAALITRSVAEMVRVGRALGARPETFYGLSGIGDLVATCHGTWSRNREFGLRIGEGRSVKELITGRRTVVEGYETTRAFAELCAREGIEAPILVEMNAILFHDRRPAAALASLMSRELKRESATPWAMA